MRTLFINFVFALASANDICTFQVRTNESEPDLLNLCSHLGKSAVKDTTSATKGSATAKCGSTQPFKIKGIKYMGLILKYLCIDFEATFDYENWPTEDMEIIQIGACIANESGEVLKQLESLVCPTRKPLITKAVTDLTKITELQILAAPSFQDVMLKLKSFVEKEDLASWLSWGAFDQVILERDCTKNNIHNPLAELKHINAKALFSKVTKHRKHVGLNRALQLQGMQFVGMQHSALDDAANLARLIPVVMQP